MITGARTDLRLKLLLELTKNPGKEYTEAELAHLLNTTSSAVAKNLRPIAEGLLKNVLKTYNVYDHNRIYIVRDKDLADTIACNIENILNSIEQLDSSLRDVNTMSGQFKEIKQLHNSGKISQKEYEERVKQLEEHLEEANP